MSCLFLLFALAFSKNTSALAIARSTALGPSTVNLATAGNFAVLAETGISTVPASSITGNIGVSPAAGTFLTGFSETLDSTGTFSTSTQVIGKLFAASYSSPTPSTLTTAVLDMQAAYNDASGRTNPNFLNLGSGKFYWEIGGLTLVPGLYKWTTGVTISTDVTISGTSSDTWIFQIAGTFNTAAGKKVILVGGALAKNIVWAVAGAVTTTSSAHLEGIVLGKTGITLGTLTSINGRILSQTMVSLQQATVVAPP